MTCESSTGLAFSASSIAVSPSLQLSLDVASWSASGRDSTTTFVWPGFCQKPIEPIVGIWFPIPSDLDRPESSSKRELHDEALIVEASAKRRLGQSLRNRFAVRFDHDRTRIGESTIQASRVTIRCTQLLDCLAKSLKTSVATFPKTSSQALIDCSISDRDILPYCDSVGFWVFVGTKNALVFHRRNV